LLIEGRLVKAYLACNLNLHLERLQCEALLAECWCYERTGVCFV